ncbi:DUF4870 domain-containing protein [Bacillus sp. FSL K6-3431]|uniref:DUF4870 domain-containing protein n=1 Tax=Bacillus sp. FSL K6-3431 TaxID=2921500 RepID=UPI0030F6A6D9
MQESTEKSVAGLLYITSLFFPVIAPLIIWLIKKDESPFIDFHGREYFNFLISYTVYSIVAGISVIILIGFILLPIVGLSAIIFTIIAAIKAFDGQTYRIPFVFRIL